MIRSIFFEAFRSISGPARIDLADITVLCGPNSAGKSSVIRAIEFFKALSSSEPWLADKDGGPIRRQPNGHCHQEQIRLGIEFVIDGSVPTSPRYEAYLNAVEAASSTVQDFWKRTIGRSMRLDVVCGGEDPGYSDKFSLSLDGQLVLEIDNDPTFFDPYLRPIEGADVDPSIELAVHGCIKVNESLMDTLLYQFPDQVREDVLRSVFWESKGEWTKIRGLRFNYFMSQPESDVSRLVEPDDSCNFIPANLERLSERVSESFTGQELGISSASNYLEWMNNALGGDLTGSLNRVRGGLETDSLRLRLFLEGLFIRLSAALAHRHVPGNRTQLDSKTPYHVGASGTIVGEHKFEGQDPHVKDYLNWWWGVSQKAAASLEGERPEESGENLVEICYSRFMPSLGRYQLHPIIYQLVGIDTKSQYMKSVDEPLLHDLAAGAFVHPYLRSDATGAYALDFSEVGSGVSFILPILASLTVGRLSIVEQPELHLHPRAQCDLGDVFIYAACNGRRSIIETHSEHLILRLSRRIRETTRGQLLPRGLQLKSDSALIYYFEPGANGRTSIHRIRFDDQGEFLDVWPDGFFAERGGELFS
jgi:hypothetical protein